MFVAAGLLLVNFERLTQQYLNISKRFDQVLAQFSYGVDFGVHFDKMMMTCKKEQPMCPPTPKGVCTAYRSVLGKKALLNCRGLDLYTISLTAN